MTSAITGTDTTQSSLLTAASKNAGSSGADFNMFLKLLTTQMKNQDPLDPMKTSEYTQQLVQYAQVEQSLQQTTALKNILGQMTGQGMAQSANFIGREASFNGATTGLDSNGRGAVWGYHLDRQASSVTATIKDGGGNVVQQLDLDPAKTDGRVVWNGVTVNGVPAPVGAYTLTVSATDAAGASVPVSVSAIGTVRNVTMDGSQVMLGMTGVQLPLSSLIAVSSVSE